MLVPSSRVTVLLGSEPERRRLVAMLTDTIDAGHCADPDPGPTTDAGRRDGGARFRRVIASPALPVEQRIELLRGAAEEPVDLVVVDRATDGLDTRDRRRFLDRLHAAADRGVAVAIDDADPVAALAVADSALRIRPGHGTVLEDVDRRPISAP